MNGFYGRIVEIVGPAGAGKSTLYRGLSQNKCFHPSNFPDVQKISSAPFFLWNGLQVLPAVLRIPKRKSRNLTRREFAWLSILRGWPKVLRKESKDHQFIILDQGPVYLFTELCEFGPELLTEQTAGGLLQGLFESWAETLSAVIFLDAPDSVLLERINRRSKAHLIKNGSVEAAGEFLDRYRDAFERTFSILKSKNSSLNILRIDTSQKKPEELVNQLLFEFSSAL